MGIICPNKNLRSWKQLVESQGLDLAYFLWNEYDGVVPKDAIKKQPEGIPSVPLSERKVKSLTDSTKQLYKDKNLLNNKGEVKTFPSEQKAKEVAAKKNLSPYYEYDARKTPTGWKVFILEPQDNALFFGNTPEEWAKEKDREDAQRQVDEDLARAGSDPFYSLEKPRVKIGVEAVFKKYPELVSIGSAQQYSSYLDSIFPNSKFKDIVYHGRSESFEEFKPTKQRSSLTDFLKGFYFSTSKGVASTYAIREVDFEIKSLEGIVDIFNTYGHFDKFFKGKDSVILQDPKSGEYLDSWGGFAEEGSYLPKNKELNIKVGKLMESNNINQIKILLKDLKTQENTSGIIGSILNIQNPLLTKTITGKITDISKKNISRDTDGVVISNISDEAENNTTRLLLADPARHTQKTIVVFKSEQIHILGSKKDVEGFKKFTKNTQYQLEGGKEKVNQELDNLLKDQLANLGISIESFEKFKNDRGIDAIAAADIVNAIIYYDESTANQLTLPEETAHFIIALMGDSPLAQRLLALVAKDDYYKDILGDNYEAYNQAYKGDVNMLVEEAAGQLLSRSLVAQFNNGILELPQQQVTLAKRLWNWVKNLFSKVDKNNWTKELSEVYGQTAEQFLVGNLRGLSKENLTKRAVLFQISDSSLNGLKKAVQEARDKSAKRLEVYRRKDKKSFVRREEEALEDLISAFDSENFLLGAVKTTQHSRDMFKSVEKRLLEVRQQFENLDTLDLREAAGVLRDMKLFKDSYVPILKDLKKEVRKLNLEHPEAVRYKTISKALTEIINVGEDLEATYFELSVPLFARYLGQFVGDGPMKDLEGALKIAEGDITFWQRWLDAMAEADDPILQLIDVAVKEAKQEAQQKAYQLQKDLIQAKMDLEKAGVKDAEWIYELDNKGIPTGNIVTEYNWGKYDDAWKTKSAQLISKYGLPTDRSARWEFLSAHPQIKSDYNKEWFNWFSENTQEHPNAVDIIEAKRKELSTEDFNEWFVNNVRISEATGAEYYTNELVLPSDKYKSDVYEDIQKNAAKKKFYDVIVSTKDAMDNLLPEQHQSGRLAPQLRQDFIERLKSVKSFEDLGRIKEEFKESFTNVEDTTELGHRFKLTNEAGNPVNFLPVHFTKKLSNTKELSTDIVASMSAYVLMAQDYSHMSKIIDLLEIGRDLVSTREVTQRDSKGNIVKERINLLGNKIEKTLTKKEGGTQAANRLDDYYKMVVYGQQRIEGKDIDILGVTLNSERMIDFIGKYTAINNLALNLYAGLQNPLIGNAMIRIEGFAKEFVDNGDLLKADIVLGKEMQKAIAQLGSRMHTNYLDLFREHFDVQQDFGERTREINMERKNLISKLFKSSSLFFINNAGEYYMQTKMSLALANRIKLKDAKGNSITMIDAYEVKGNRLVLKEGVTKEDGTAWAKEDERLFMRRQNFVNKRLHGIYNDIDRSAIQQFAVGRLAIMFRKFMRPGFNRRYRKLQYNYEGQTFTEGYYRTTGRFMKVLVKDLKRGQFLLATHWNELSDTEKRNMFRTLTEAAYLIAAMIFANIAMSIKGANDDDEWVLNMIAYQANRMITEMGFYIDPRQTVTILQSPAAGIDQVNKLFNFIAISLPPWTKTFDVIERGKYEGITRWHRSAIGVIPLYDTMTDAVHPSDKLVFFINK